MFGKLLKWFGKSDSPAGQVVAADAVKSLRTAAITALAAGGVVFLQSVSQMDFGPYGVLAAPVIAGGIDYLRRWVTDNK